MSRIMTAKGVLRSARKLLSDKKHWTRNASARTSSGRITDTNNPDAVRFCATGALRYANGTFYQASNSLYPQVGSVVNLNDRLAKDGGGYKAVLRVYDEAIKAA